MTVPVTQITSAGPVVPAFTDVLAAIQSDFQGIFGADAYIAPDSQDGQLLAIFSQAISDLCQQIANLYAQFSPQTAVGVCLDQVVKVNGIRRKSATPSTCPIVISGTANTTIAAGLVGDDLGLGTQWALPPNVQIPGGGTITVTATCTTNGAILVAEGHINTIIGGATSGWQSAVNEVLPTAGSPIETDLALRQRQSISVALAALTPLSTILGAVSNVTGVIRYAIYENDTDSWDNHGLPPHSISIVVEGGAVGDVANAIAATKNPGTGTYGTTSQIVLDSAGVANTINFMELNQVETTVVINIRALSGYASTTTALIQQVVSAWISQLPIGSVVYLDKVRPAADLQGTIATQTTGKDQEILDQLSATYVIYGITLSRSPNIPETYVTGGPYAAGVTTVTVADASRMYPGQAIQFTLDNGTALNTTLDLSIISGNTIDFANAIPTSRSILTNAPVYLTLDVSTAFYEAPFAATTDVTVNVS